MQFNLNSINNFRTKMEVFGDNVQYTLEKGKKGVYTSLFNFFNKNQEVFNGDINKEIEKYNFRTMRLGMLMRKDLPRTTFDATF